MKRILILSLLMVFTACKNKEATSPQTEKAVDSTAIKDSSIVDKISDKLLNVKPVVLTLEEANKLAKLPLACITTEYPNKLGQTLTGKNDLQEPNVLHPAFYGCFDWHSAVHAHWSLVHLLKEFPNLEKAEKIKEQLQKNLSAENIKKEVAYFKKEENKTYERTYGWVWLLKLADELKNWDDPLAKELDKNLQPLTKVIVAKYMDFLPKLNYPIRVGTHTNTAFGLTFAYDYAQTTNNQKLMDLIATKAKSFYLNDDNCPISWEPGGFDFLSPCLEEVDIMQRVLSEQAFKLWVDDFLPQLTKKEFDMEVAEVSDRTDGHLVHLDGLNFSRAWVFYHLANKYKEFEHLKRVGDKHVAHSFPNLMGDSYEGGHWLGTYAIYALSQRDK